MNNKMISMIVKVTLVAIVLFSLSFVSCVLTNREYLLENKAFVNPDVSTAMSNPIEEAGDIVESERYAPKLITAGVTFSSLLVPNNWMLLKPTSVFAQLAEPSAGTSATILGLSPATFGWFCAAAVVSVVVVFKDKIEKPNPPPVPGNTPPIASFSVASETSTSESITLRFDASACSDTETPASQLQVRWDWNNDGNYDTGYNTTKTMTRVYSTTITPTNNVTIEVIDAGGLTDTATISITSPSAVITVTVLATSNATTAVLSFDASGVSDAETTVADLQIRWDWQNDGIWDTSYSTTKTNTQQFSAPVTPTNTVRVEVLDGLGLTATATTSFTSPIPLFNVTVISQTSYNSVWLNLDASASTDTEDAQADLTVRWDFESDGISDTAFSTTKTVAREYPLGGPPPFTIQMELMDTMGLSGIVTRTVSAPTALIVLSPATGTFTTVFTFDGSNSFDLQDSASSLQVRWDFDNNGVWDYPVAGYVTTKTATYIYPVTMTSSAVTVRLEVVDTIGLTGTATAQVFINNNSPIANFSVTPLEGGSGITFTFDASLSSDEETPLSDLRFRWDFDNNGVWDYPAAGYVATRTASYAYPLTTFGIVTIKLEVLDTDALTGSVTSSVNITNGIDGTSPSAMFRGDVRHTALSSYVGPVSVTLKWNYAVSGTITSSAAIGTEGTVYFGSISGTVGALYALNPNGSLKWSYNNGGVMGAIRSSPAIDSSGNVYFESSNGYLYSLDSSGTFRWKYQSDSTPRGGTIFDSSPAIDTAGRIYIGSYANNQLSAVSPITGGDGSIWDYGGLTASIDSSPAIDTARQIVYFGANDGKLHAVDISGSAPGTLKWYYGLNGVVLSSPAIASDGVVYIGTEAGTLYAINPSDSSSTTVKWTYVAGGSIRTSPAISSDGTIYFGSTNNNLYALSSTGALKAGWPKALPSSIISSPLVSANGIIYVGCDDGVLRAYDTAGTLVWSYNIGIAIKSSPVLSKGGTLYVGANDGKMYAFDAPGGGSGVMASPHPKFHHNVAQTGLSVYSGPATNTTLWSYNTGGAIYSSPSIAEDGTVYVGSNNNGFYAFDSDGALKLSWPMVTSDTVRSSPAIGADGIIYVGSDTGYLYAINSNRSIKWRYAAGGAIYSSPTIDQSGNIYFGCLDGKVHKINPSGANVWSFTTNGSVYSSPALASDGTVYVGTVTATLGTLYAISSGGAQQWIYNAGSPIYSSPAVVPAGVAGAGNIIFGTEFGNIYAVDSTGALVAGFPYLAGGSIMYSSPAVDSAGNIYIGAANGSLYSLNASGVARVGYPYLATGAINSSPAICNSGRVYFGSEGGFFYAITATTGALAWSKVITGGVYSSPAIGKNTTAGGKIYFGGLDGYLYAVGEDPASLRITKQANKQRVSIGDVVTYKVTVKNSGIDPSLQTLIYDRIPYGFKYIKGSTLLDGVKAVDPAGDKTLTYDIGWIGTTPTAQTKVLSYQLVVGSGVTFGKYENKAVANYFDTQWKTSNVAKETVLVVPDPLFDLGTIIGKVFDDSNGNGMQDDGENGIGHARIIMEDGTIVVTDKDGKYHVPGVIPGTHLLRLVSVPGNSENSNKSSRKIDVSENPKVVRVTEGLLCKVNFGVIKGGNVSGSEGKGSDVTEGEPDLTILALGEGVAGYNNSTGNLDPVAHDDAYDDGFYSRGRMAYYLKYTTDNRRYRVTSSFDSKRNRYRELYRYIDPDKYYPNYGDDSTISWDATNTQGLLYLKGEHLPSNSSFLLGNYQTDLNGTELLNYNRTLYGVEFKLNNNVSGQGEYFLLPNTGVKLFGAQAYQIAAHNELKATGGSFYYLKHNNIVAGSERVSVEVRDKVSNMMLSRVTKVMGIDYEIDYGNGRIMFNYPIQSVESSDTIISTGILDGSPVYVVVDYEYEPDRLHLNEGTYGGRIEHSPTKDIKIGVSAVSEEEDDTDYMLQGADIKWSLPKDTTITGEYAESESRGIPNHISLNGGLSFDTVTNGPTTEGSGYQVRVSSKPLEKVDTGGYYQRLRPGFISSGTFIHQGTEKYGFNALTRLTDELSVLIKYDAQELLRQYNLVSGALVGGQKTRVTSLQGIYQKNRLSLTGEYRYQSVEDTLANTTSESNRDTALGALRAGYKLTDKFNLYMEQQATLKGDTNHQTTLGASAEVMKGMHTNLQGTSGTTGNSVLLGITSNVSEKTNVFTNFSYGVTSGANPVRTTTTTGGLSSQLTPETRVYVQEQYQTSPSSVATAEAVGQESSLDDKWRLGCSFERGMVNNFDGTDTVRKSGSINLGYNDKESLVFGTKLEGRLDEGVSDRTQYTTSNDIKYKLTHDFSILGRLKWSRTENDTTDEIEGLFKESGVGLAFRPVSWDKLNLIGKYTYLIDQHPQTKLAGTAANIDPLDITKERASVYALEGAYDLPWCQVVGKYAFKNGQEKVGGRAYTDSDTILWISRINYHVINKWDAGVEYRVLEQKLADDKKTGMLVEAMYKINEYAQLGIGYNFTDFTDDLINDNDYKVTGPFIRFVGTFSR